MKVAKASETDISVTRAFLQACEAFWDNRRPGPFNMERDWLNWDDDDPDKILLLRIQRELCDEEGEEKVDNRLVLFEYLKRKYQAADCRWSRVIMAADVLIDNVCDPTEGHLSFYPGFECMHVSPEQ